ncbi:theg spermatid protein [Electrophorus electricus]|uniref:theg spermatid protein n=1 Tax=Electrophorus electricus TaxID=8005 RepID=UPI0015D01E08|nr:theg spermatid protein [Electrophorus electricus]XP_026875491.2 theg spermatid protein [Electrophorus electricus]
MARRIDRLAQPKPNLLKFPDRCSVYWLDKLPAKSNSPATTFDLTPRWFRLSESKKCPSFENNSRSPEWKVSGAALKACPSDRISALALPRLPAAGCQPDRPLLPTTSLAMRTTRVSARICQLACPNKNRRMLTHSCSSSETSQAAPQKTLPSLRTLLLATPSRSTLCTVRTGPCRGLCRGPLGRLWPIKGCRCCPRPGPASPCARVLTPTV